MNPKSPLREEPRVSMASMVIENWGCKKKSGGKIGLRIVNGDSCRNEMVMMIVV